MDARERFDDPEETLRAAFEGMRASLQTALPGIIVSFDPVKVTAVVQPALRAVQQGADGAYSGLDLPVLPDVPVVFPHAGGATLTFPVKPGDECLLIFAARCIDAWWQSGGVQFPVEPRMHDLSDAFAILGPMSLPKAIAGISGSAVQLRSDDGAAFVEINPTTHKVTVSTSGAVDVTAGGDINLTAATIKLNGAVQITGALTNNGKAVGSTHVHGGVQTGGGSTGVPT